MEPYTLRFRRPARTSRGEYETKRVYYLRIQSLEQAAHVGYGECAPMPQLSCDDLPNYLSLIHIYIRTSLHIVTRPALTSNF